MTVTFTKVADLDGAKLAVWVAMAVGNPSFDVRIHNEKCQVLGIPWVREFSGKPTREWEEFEPHVDWRTGGMIIEKERITLIAFEDGMGSKYRGCYYGQGLGHFDAPTALVAAMRAFVAKKFGEEVPV